MGSGGTAPQFLTSVPDGGSNTFLAFAALLMGKSPQYPVMEIPQQMNNPLLLDHTLVIISRYKYNIK
jgi:hypothetical protein